MDGPNPIPSDLLEEARRLARESLEAKINTGACKLLSCIPSMVRGAARQGKDSLVINPASIDSDDTVARAILSRVGQALNARGFNATSYATGLTVSWKSA